MHLVNSVVTALPCVDSERRCWLCAADCVTFLPLFCSDIFCCNRGRSFKTAQIHFYLLHIWIYFSFKRITPLLCLWICFNGFFDVGRSQRSVDRPGCASLSLFAEGSEGTGSILRSRRAGGGIICWKYCSRFGNRCAKTGLRQRSDCNKRKSTICWFKP